MTFSGGGGPRGGGAGASLTDARAGVESALRDRPLLRRIGGLFHPYRRELWVIAGLIVITSGLGVVSPLLLKVVFDRALFVSGGPRLGLLYVLLALMVASTVVSALDGVYARLYKEQFSDGIVEAKCADGVRLSDGHVITLDLAREPGLEDSGASPAPESVSR